MSRETELKPCPFCGHKANIYHIPVQTTKFNPTLSVEGLGSLGYKTTTNTTKYAIKCVKCKASVGAYATLKAAEDAWNRRANYE